MSCEVKESDLQGLMTELENIPNISRKENIKADEKARYELEECQIIVYKTGEIIFNLHYKYLGILAKFCIDYDEQTIQNQTETK